MLPVGFLNPQLACILCLDTDDNHRLGINASAARFIDLNIAKAERLDNRSHISDFNIQRLFDLDDRAAFKVDTEIEATRRNEKQGEHNQHC